MRCIQCMTRTATYLVLARRSSILVQRSWAVNVTLQTFKTTFCKVVANAATLHPILLTHWAAALSWLADRLMSPRCSFGAITVVKMIAVSRANCLNCLSTYASTLCGLPRLLTLNRSVTVWWWNTCSTGKCGNGVDNRQTLLTTAPLHTHIWGGACSFGVSSIPVRTGPQRSPILGFPYMYAYTICCRLPNLTR